MISFACIIHFETINMIKIIYLGKLHCILNKDFWKETVCNKSNCHRFLSAEQEHDVLHSILLVPSCCIISFSTQCSLCDVIITQLSWPAMPHFRPVQPANRNILHYRIYLCVPGWKSHHQHHCQLDQHLRDHTQRREEFSGKYPVLN